MSIFAWKPAPTQPAASRSERRRAPSTARCQAAAARTRHIVRAPSSTACPNVDAITGVKALRAVEGSRAVNHLDQRCYDDDRNPAPVGTHLVVVADELDQHPLQMTLAEDQQ